MFKVCQGKLNEFNKKHFIWKGLKKYVKDIRDEENCRRITFRATWITVDPHFCSTSRRTFTSIKQTTEWKQYEIIRLNVNHNITIFLYKINFKIIKYLLFCYRIENREFEWEFPTFLSKFGFIGFIGLMEIQCMYVRVRAARIRERKGDRLEPQASRYPRISGRAVYSLQPTIL